jgi:Tol biopolymer transport system component
MAGILAAAWLAFVHFRDEPAPAIPLIRAEIPLPDNVDLVNESPFLLSPDGRYLAFIARDYGGMEHIWIRALDSSEARPMLETESDHISSIFWSPDSRFIAYDSGGKLKKIDIMGGPPRELCDIPPNAWGGSWNRQGTIVFMAAGNLMGVSEEGGDAYPVTDLNVTELKPPDVRRLVSSLNLDNPTLQRTSADFLPVLLPDGRHFLYYHSSENPEKGEVCLGTFKSVPDAPDPEPLVTDTLGFVYMPSPDAGPGFLLFLRGQTLMAQLFDEKQLKLLGVALPVADKVGSIVNRCFFSASSNGVLVYRSGIASPLTQTTLFDRQGKKIGKVGESGNFYGMAFSPNGEQVALGWDPEPLTTAITADIWIFNLLSGYRSQLTFKALNATPLWSHDGTRIVFGSSRDRTHMALYQKLVQEPKREELLLEHGNIPTSWSSDGRFLLFSRRDPETKSDLWVLPMEGDHKEEPLRVLPAENDEMDGRFSPDMRWIAYVSDEEDRYEVYVRKFSPHSAAKATEFGARWKVSQEGGMGPRWHRDSKELYYRSPDGSVMAVEITDDPAFPAGKPRTLFPAPRVWSQYIAFPAFVTWDVSTDGNRFLLPVPTEETAPVPFTLVLNWTSLLKK